MISDYFKISLKNLRRRKLRSWLTMLGIIISIATIFVLVALSLGLEQAVQEQFEQLGADKFFIQPRGQLGPPGSTSLAAELTIADVEVIEKIPGIVDYTYYTIGNTKVEFKDEVRYVLSIGFPLERVDLFIETGFYKPDEGRLIQDGDEGKVMIGSQYKYNNFFKRPLTNDDKILLNDKQEFEILTILESVGNPSDDRFIYMSYNDFRPLYEIPDRIDVIMLKVDNVDNINQIAERTQRKLLKARNLDEDTRDFTILTPEEVLESFGQILNIITGFLFGVAAISLLVGAVGIANTMFTSVIERTKEIGTMKAVGAKNSDVMLLFLIESGFLGLVGGVIGILLGMGIGKLIEYIAVNQLATTILKVSFPAWLIVSVLAFSFIIGAVSGTWPAWRASRISPVEALRYE